LVRLVVLLVVFSSIADMAAALFIAMGQAGIPIFVTCNGANAKGNVSLIVQESSELVPPLELEPSELVPLLEFSSAAVLKPLDVFSKLYAKGVGLVLLLWYKIEAVLIEALLIESSGSSAASGNAASVKCC